MKKIMVFMIFFIALLTLVSARETKCFENLYINENNQDGRVCVTASGTTDVANVIPAYGNYVFKDSAGHTVLTMQDAYTEESYATGYYINEDGSWDRLSSGQLTPPPAPEAPVVPEALEVSANLNLAPSSASSHSDIGALAATPADLFSDDLVDGACEGTCTNRLQGYHFGRHYNDVNFDCSGVSSGQTCRSWCTNGGDVRKNCYQEDRRCTGIESQNCYDISGGGDAAFTPEGSIPITPLRVDNIVNEDQADDPPSSSGGGNTQSGSWNIERQDDNNVKATSPRGTEYNYVSEIGTLASEPPEERDGLTELGFQDGYNANARLNSFHVGNVEYNLIESGSVAAGNYRQIFQAPDGEMFQFVTDEHCASGCWVEVYQKTDNTYDFCGNNLGNGPCKEVSAPTGDGAVTLTEHMYRDRFSSSVLTTEHGTTIGALNQGGGSTQSEILSHSEDGNTEHYAEVNGEYVEVYNDGGTWKVCTSAQDGSQCDSQNDGLASNVLNEAEFGDLNIPTVPEAPTTNPGDTVAESQRIYSTGWGGRDGINWDAAIAESLQLAGSTQWLSDLVIGEDHRIQTRERYDRFMSNVFNTEYFSSAICSAQLPEVLPGQGLGQIIDSRGNPMTVAHITGQKHGPQIFMCDLESEEQCPMVGDVQSECVDMVCEIDDELVEGYLYVIEWSVRAPSPLVLESCQHSINGCNDGLGIQIKLDMGEDTEKRLYEDAYGSEYPLVLLPGAQESDRIITTSLVDYSTVTIDFHDPIMSAMGAGTTRFMGSKLGTDEDQTDRLSRVYNTITEISSPTTFTYGPELELPPSTLSSSTSTVEQVDI